MCADFHHEVIILLPHELAQVLKFVVPAVEAGSLRIESGSLAYEDVIVCDLSCTACGGRFHLDCETYHGSGGKWTPV